jgi:hypothetical protein
MLYKLLFMAPSHEEYFRYGSLALKVKAPCRQQFLNFLFFHLSFIKIIIWTRLLSSFVPRSNVAPDFGMIESNEAICILWLISMHYLHLPFFPP